MSVTPQKLRLREQVRAVIRTRRYSQRTEKSYWYWIRYFIRFHGMQHPRGIAEAEMREFLTWLAVHRNVAAALNALVPLQRGGKGKTSATVARGVDA